MEDNMKFKVLSVLLILAIVSLGLNVGLASAQAYDTPFTTSITYQNVGQSATTQLEIWFYEGPDDISPTIVPRDNLNSGAGTSVFIGGLSQINQGFRGTAIMVSDQPLLATLVQLPQNSPIVKNRPLSNGFSSGTEDSLIPTVIKNAFGGAWTTTFSVQNVGPAATSVDIKFYNTSASLVHTIQQSLQPGAGYFVDTGTVGAIGSTFNGSVVIESNGGSIISSAMEQQKTDVGARAFEGLGSGETKFYMPSAMCQYPVAWGFANSFFAVQNTSLSTSTNVTVKYYDTSGANVGNQTKSVGPGAKASFGACEVTPNGFLGAATVESTTTPVVAMGKVEGMGIATAYVGIGNGSEKVALPYVRWALQQDYDSGAQQRVYITIQNVGDSTITGNVYVDYIDRNGLVVGTHTITADINAGSKVNSTAPNAGLQQFGVYDNGASFGGGVIVRGPAGSELAAVARVQSYVPATGLQAAEDYNGMPVP